jgi:hypothetical protein
LRRQSHELRHQSIAVDIDVVTECRDRNRRVLCCGYRIVDRNRRVADGRDIHRNRRDPGLGNAIADSISKRIHAIEISIGRVGNRAVRIHRNRTVRRRGNDRRSECIEVRIRIVRQDCDSDRLIFLSRNGIVHRDWCRAHGRDRNRHRCHIRIQAAVICAVRKLIRAVEVRIRRVAEPAVSKQRDCAIRSGRHQRRRQ